MVSTTTAAYAAATLIIYTSLAVVAGAAPNPDGVGAPKKWVSIVGDPGMASPQPRVLLEGWNFCNRCGRACDVAPRWADCVSPEGKQLVSAAANAAGLPRPQQSQPTCDAYTEQKERDLGKLCERPNAQDEPTYFWTAMLKSGAMNVTERGRLCGLWCEKKTPSCNPPHDDGDEGDGAAVAWPDDDYVMRQPFVKHVPSHRDDDEAGGWRGSFYGTYDPATPLDALPTPDAVAAGGGLPPNASAPIPSYFGWEWFARGGRRVFRHVVRAGHDLQWLMLYTGAEGSGPGGKGGYPWDGRGMYAPSPVSTTRNASTWTPQPGQERLPPNNFKVRMWTNISRFSSGPGFYFLNHGACWKDDGRQCDGDADTGNATDVTRYVLFQLRPKGEAPALDDPARCGPREEQRRHCPMHHTYRNGTTVLLGDARFPYGAYHSVPTRGRRRGLGGAANGVCKNDCWSNPIDQDWVRIEPAPEWGEYGYPSSNDEAYEAREWEMDAGAVTAATSVHFQGVTPAVMRWPTLNSGPEMLSPPGAYTVWETAGIDVLIEAGSQG